MILTNDATKYFHIDRRTVVIVDGVPKLVRDLFPGQTVFDTLIKFLFYSILCTTLKPFFSSLVFLRTLPVRFSGLQRYILIQDGGKGRKNKVDHFSLRPSTNAILNHSMMTPCLYSGKKGGLCTIPPSRYLNRRHIDRGKSSRGGRR